MPPANSTTSPASPDAGCASIKSIQAPLHKPFAVARLLLGLAGVAAVTALFSGPVQAHFSTAGFFFLLVVLGVAATSGFRVSSLVSVVAALCFNFFFLPPLGRFTIADPENWVALLTFLLTALVASHLSDRAQRQAAEARRSQLETEQLYSLSRAILLTDSSHPIATQAAQSIARIFHLPAVFLLDAHSGLTSRGGPAEIASPDPRLEEVVRLGSPQRHPAEDLAIWPISLGGNPIGALAAVGGRLSDAAAQSMLNLVAIALERVRTQEAANRADAARQSEEFKSTLLDAIAHEFKTPLTSIKAAATGLRTIDPARRDDQSELTAIIEEETDRLSRLVTEAVRMAEIDAGKITLRRAPAAPLALLEAARTSFEGRGAERIEIHLPPLPDCNVDRDLLLLALRHVLDNALKYAPAASPIHCSATLDPSSLTLRIADAGPGVPERDRERIFDKFYRRPGTRDLVPGTGLGLPIAREILRIHSGDLWVESAAPQGAAFCFRLPLDGVSHP